MNPVYMWLAALAAFLIIEIATMGLTTIWFAGGALVALALALMGISFYVQMGVFLMVSIILLMGTRPVAMKYFNQKREKTNVDSVIGKQAIVLTTIDNLKAEGKVMVSGMEWTARAYDGKTIIKEGTVVEIKEVRGVKLMVTEKGRE